MIIDAPTIAMIQAPRVSYILANVLISKVAGEMEIYNITSTIIICEKKTPTPSHDVYIRETVKFFTDVL
jgi:hypothetical protein